MFRQEYGGAEEPVKAILFKDNQMENRLQNLVMVMLKAMTNSSIPEVFGHNMPLFIADSVAKWHNSETRRIIDSTGVWMANSHDLRRFVFYMSTFREGGVNLSRVEEKLKEYFTDFDGKFDAQLSNVMTSRMEVDEQFGTSSPYMCRVKAQYSRELLRLLDDGMLLAVRNFKSDSTRERYTLLEVIRFWPEHFGLRGVRDYQYFPCSSR